MKRGGESSCTSFLGIDSGVGGGDVLSTVVLCGGSLKLVSSAGTRERAPSLGTFQKTISSIVKRYWL